MIEVWNKIEYEEEEMGDDEYLDDGEDAEVSSFSGAEEDDVASKPSEAELVVNHGDDNAEDIGSIMSELSAGGLDETIEDEQSDYSDGLLLSGDDQDNVDEQDGSLTYGNTLDDQQINCSDVWKMEKGSQSQAQHSPHVKISALTGVGLQELLESSRND